MTAQPIVIAIVGPPGSGKSTICRALVRRRRYELIPEYIDMKPPGKFTRPAQALQDWIGGRMTLFSFQDFIANLVNWYLSEMRVSAQVRVIESSLAIATEIYAVAGLDRGAITKLEVGLLRQKADQISDTWGLPRVHLVNEKPRIRTRAVHVRVLHGFQEETLTNVLAALDTHFSAYPTESVVVMLDTRTEEIQERITQRGRGGEDSYTTEYITDIWQRYHDLFA